MSYTITDIEAADAFAQDHKENVRYVEPWHEWVVWKGDRWVVGQEADINSKAEHTVRKFEQQAMSIHHSAVITPFGWFALGVELDEFVHEDDKQGCILEWCARH